MKFSISFVAFCAALFLFGSSATAQSQSVGPAGLLYSWKFLNFTFRSQNDYNTYMNGNFKSCMLAGVKQSASGPLFVSVPRWKEGVPATIAKLVGGLDRPLLEPYPSWEYNEIGNPKAFQSVLGFEIDSKNRLWVLDQGKVNGSAAIPGTIKLVVFDLNTDTEIARHVFADHVASRHNSFLNDIVVDIKRDVAYITDSGLRVDEQTPLHGGLIVYDLKTDNAWRVLNKFESVQPNETLRIFINGERVLKQNPMMTGADGIALSADFSTLYWTPLTSHVIYSLPAALLRNQSLSNEEVNSQTKIAVLDKRTASDGLACSNEVENGVLYVTSLDDSSVRRLVLGPDGYVLKDETLAQSSDAMVWPDTIGFNHRGSLLFTSNRLNHFLDGSLDFTQENFRVYSVYIGANSYSDPST